MTRDTTPNPAEVVSLINEIERLVKVANKESKIVDYTYPDGRGFTLIDGQKYDKRPITPAVLHLRSLTALVDYIKSSKDEAIVSRGTIIQVVNPTCVCLLADHDPLYGDMAQLVEVQALTPEQRFGQRLCKENFIVWLQTGFLQTGDCLQIEDIAGHIVIDNAAELDDSGVAQTVTIKKGISLKSEIKAPNPVMLSPYRTFNEVIQPESAFVFRIESGNEPYFILHEADGGAWKQAATRRIKEYLETELFDTNLTILA